MVMMLSVALLLVEQPQRIRIVVFGESGQPDSKSSSLHKRDQEARNAAEFCK
jgi:hypothetical protein